MDSTPLVTIAIPTYNRADGYLRGCIASALDQGYPNLEVVVSDNCSVDDTSGLVASFADERLRYIKHPENIGATNNFNFCLQEARGTYFLLLHDDDLIDKDFVESCISATDGKEYGLIRTGTRIMEGDGKVKRRPLNFCTGDDLESLCESWFADKTAIYQCSTLYNTAALRAVGEFHSRTGVFLDALAILLIAAKYPVLNIEAAKAAFREHAGEMTFAATVADWCVDSHQLIDVVDDCCRYDKEKLHQAACDFFARLNYRRADAVKTRGKRLWAYFIVMKAFNFKYMPPPLRRILRR